MATNQIGDDEHKPTNEFKVVPDDKFTVTWRKEAPVHYTLEMESLPFLSKILSKTGLDTYESTVFEACGYKWRLILYPEGDKQRNGDDHISLYLRIEDHFQNLEPGWEVDALLTFFLFNYNKDQFMSIQGGRLNRFNAIQKEWGFSQLLPLAEFIDTSKGYLMGNEGKCKFGVEVFLIKNQGKGECFFVRDNPSKNPYSWTIENFSKLPESGHFSDEFSVGDYKWKLHIYPKGVPKVQKKFISIYLWLQDHQKFPSGTKIYVEFKMRISDQRNEENSKTTEKAGNAWFSTSDKAWGFPYFIRLPVLESKDGHGLIVNDCVVVEAEITSMSMTKDLSQRNC
ncbi:TRAF-like family protein [Corchorus olitorius]|uniref:TRAF-like family protein n=1 Tax=Corchorus olitorius TaxID=93759 RepID=A0A1R3HPL1_9ROSI|nr:TRAF-like family protein [Corchorus olitorius]